MMKSFLTILALTSALTACAGDKYNGHLAVSGSAMQGTLIGRWASECLKEGENYNKKELLFTATGGVGMAKTYKDAACKGAVIGTGGPTSFTYTIKDKPSTGEARLMMKVGDHPAQPAEIVMFDDLMSLNLFGTPINYLRVTK